MFGKLKTLLLSFGKQKKYDLLAVCSLLLLIGLLGFVNYKPATFLTGWDNLHPEFNFAANFQRSFFAVWQEYQGLGLLGGMGHAADLIHVLIVFLLSFLLPLNLLRYSFVFLTLLTGGMGAYFLTRFVLQKSFSDLTAPRLQTLSLIAALFYILNLATVQQFYAPFEAFIAHFAVLPWLLLASLVFLTKDNFKNFILLVVILLLATPASYIPTLFVVFLFAISILDLSFIIFLHTKRVFLASLKLFAAIFVVNSFWLLPFLYFTFTNAQVNINSKQNQMVTETVFLNNKEFGNLSNVALLKSFWFHTVEPDLKGNLSYMMTPWIKHFSSPLIPLIGYFLFSIVILGFIASIRSKKPILLGFSIVFLFALTMLTTNTAPFSTLDVIFRKIPLFNQAFRFPFTKFSILAGLMYSLFFCLGLKIITDKAGKIYTNKQISGIFITAALLLITYTFPIFRGNLFYDKEKIKIPVEYFALFDFFKQQDPNTRIANFPQPTFWGWEYYKWGYGGSGFPWYGIKQPILDRAFDVWSKTDENYYFEISHALYTKNKDAFLNVLNKYQITWLLIDKNILFPSSPLSLFVPELEQMLSQMPSVSKVKTFGSLEIYKVALSDKPKNYVFLSNTKAVINPYKWTDNDLAYQTFGTYLSPLRKDTQTAYFYPFRSLFSLKSQKDLSFSLSEEKDKLILTNKIPPGSAGTLLIPSFLETETSIPVTFEEKFAKGILSLYVTFQTPEIWLDKQKLRGEKTTYKLDIPSFSDKININGAVNYNLKTENKTLGTTFLSTREDNVLVVSRNGKMLKSLQITPEFLKTFAIFKPAQITIPQHKEVLLKVIYPKIIDNYLGQKLNPLSLQKEVKSCDPFRPGFVSAQKTDYKGEKGLIFTSRNATACAAFYTANPFHRQAYALFIRQKNNQGRGLNFWLENIDEKRASLNTFLPDGGRDTLSTFILPPQDVFGRSYALHFDNISIGQDETSNTLLTVNLYPFAYNFATNLLLAQNALPKQKPVSTSIQSSHPNESLYVLSLPNLTSPQTLVLSQSFATGWRAYQVDTNCQKKNFKCFFNVTFPFFFGKELKGHVLVNNWANGWVLDTTSNLPKTSVVILYLPQYLEYLGFFFLFILILGSAIYACRRVLNRSA